MAERAVPRVRCRSSCTRTISTPCTTRSRTARRFSTATCSSSANSIPTRHLVRDGKAKAVLREAVRGIAPDAIIDNPPQGRLQRADPRLPRRATIRTCAATCSTTARSSTSSPRADRAADRAAPSCRTARASSCSTSSTARCSSKSLPRECAGAARCILPDTRPNLTLNADGICNACASHATKREIDWAARAQAFRRRRRATPRRAAAATTASSRSAAARTAPGRSSSASKHGLNPLAVTWRPPGRTGDRPAQPRQSRRARRRSHRLSDQPGGRAQVHVRGACALRLDRHPDAPGDLRHPGEDRRALRHSADRVGRELRVRIRRRRGRAHRLQARCRLAAATYGVTHGTTAARLDLRAS